MQPNLCADVTWTEQHIGRFARRLTDAQMSGFRLTLQWRLGRALAYLRARTARG